MWYSALLLMEITWVPQKHQSSQQSDLSQASILLFQKSKSQGKHQDFKLSIVSHSRAQAN